MSAKGMVRLSLSLRLVLKFFDAFSLRLRVSALNLLILLLFASRAERDGEESPLPWWERVRERGKGTMPETAQNSPASKVLNNSKGIHR